MKVLILGATGIFGNALVKKLEQETDYELTLLSRHASKVYGNGPHRVINGSATDYSVLSEAVKGQDVVYCAISGDELPDVAKCLVKAMPVKGRLLFMGAVGIYNEIPVEIDGDDNLDNEPAQVPNRLAVDVIEASELNYTVLRPGYLREGDVDDYVITMKGEAAKGYISTIPSVIKLAMKLMEDKTLYSRQSVSITKDMR